VLDLLFTNPAAFVVIFGGIIIAIGIHEFAHCFMADRLGDPTPRSMGRLTLNPLAHLDPLGTLMILITGLFGWGKPSPFDPYNLKHPKKDTAVIALAGPVSNLILAALLSLILRTASLPQNVGLIVFGLLTLNVNLALFNLLPVPPLDGSKILGVFLTNEQALRLSSFAGRNSFLLLFLFILPLFAGRSLAYLLVSPVSQLLINLLLP